MTLFNTKKGYTLLFAVIVSSVVLSIAAFILSISRKQFIISSASRDSTKAVYAADSAIQCAVEKYFKSSIFSTSTPSSISCNGVSASLSWASGSGASMNFKPGNIVYVSASNPAFWHFTNGTCAKLTFYSGVDNDSGLMKTYIESRGYSMGSVSQCPIISPRTVERAIYLVYY